MDSASSENSKAVEKLQMDIRRLGYYIALRPRNTRDSEFVDYISPDSAISVAWLEKRLAVVSRRQQAFDEFVAKSTDGMRSVLHSDFFWHSSGIADIRVLVRLASTCQHFTRLMLSKDILQTVFQNMTVVWRHHLWIVDQYKTYLMQRQQCLAFYRRFSRDTTLMRLNNFIDFEREHEIREELVQSREQELEQLRAAFQNIATDDDVEVSKAWFQHYDNIYFCACAVTLTAAIFRSRTSPVEMFHSSLQAHDGDMAVFLWHQFCNGKTKALSRQIMQAYNVKLDEQAPSHHDLSPSLAPTLDDWEAIYGSLRYHQQTEQDDVPGHGDDDQRVHDVVVEERGVKRVKY